MMRSVTLPPAGWHDDPFGRHQLRYWDGVRWTEHVADSGTAGVDPPDAEASSRTVHVDTQVRVGIKTRRLFVDDQAIWFGEESYRYSDVTSMTWWTTRVNAGPAHNIHYQIRLWRQGIDKKDRTITFSGRGDDHRIAYDKTVDALLRQVGPRRVDDVLRRVEAGESVEVARVVLTRSGMALRKKQVEWSTPFRLVSHSQDGTPWMTVQVDVGGKEKKVGEYAGILPDAPLVPFLLQTLAERYGRPPQA
jgi:Protein of unknown function (DUF2510)